MIKTIKTTKFKITAFVLALMLTVFCVLWNTTRVHAQELDITGVNTTGYAVPGRAAIIDGQNVLTHDGQSETAMSVFITGGSEAKYNAANVKWELDDGGWCRDSTEPVLFEGENSQQMISALYPYDQNAMNGVSTINISGGENQVDYLVATSTPLNSSSVNLTMTHALAKIVLNLTRVTEVNTSDKIDKVEVQGMYASGDLNIAENAWSNLSDANATLEMNDKNELLVIPMDDCESFNVVIAMNSGRRFTTTVDLSGVDYKLAGGTQYNINLQVGQDVVTLGDITANPWIQETVDEPLKTE